MAVRPPELRSTLVAALREARSADGGFGLAPGAASEVEPTAIAALALEDAGARAWLAAAQRPDGGFAALDGRPESPSVAALAALALADPDAALRALAYAVANRAILTGESGNDDGDGRDGWGWTNDTYSWVEPTSRVLLATKILRPADSATRSEAVRILDQRRCPDGGWNYGNASVKGVDLRAYAQTTAVALLSLQGEPAALIDPPLSFLERRWRDEPGGLTLAQTLIAFRLHRREGASEVRDALASVYRKSAFLHNVAALAWATLAAAPAATLDRLRFTP